MARNEEKHVTRLNRLILQQQREEELKKNPPRPKLATLHSAKEIKKWLPSIKKDIDFYLKQSQVTCYPERKIKEFEGEIDRLQREYKAFVRRLRELDPSSREVPWTERAYSQRKRKHSPPPDSIEESEVSDPKKNVPFLPEEVPTFTPSQRLPLPILTSSAETQYQIDQEQRPNLDTGQQYAASNDAPLDFGSSNKSNEQKTEESPTFNPLGLQYSSSESEEDT